mmetsp:Transcript_7745/g.20633  ORF Transcript_7745/g.20633 Transcript_7745/m.20633 type:complete len:601 (-) Transcript_7745:579-2381(-)
MGACVSKDTWEPAPAPAVLPPKPKPPSNGPSDAIEPFQRAGTVEEHDEDASSFCSVARLGGDELPRSHSRNPQQHTSDPQSRPLRGSPSVTHTSSDIWAQDEAPRYSPGRGSGEQGNSGHKSPSHPEVANDSVMPLRPCGPSMPVSWKMGDSVGSGSFGNVYLGLNNDTGELLAIKSVSLMDDSGNSQRQEALEQLEHEVSLLSGLDHPNVVRYVGTMREGASLLIFLEYVPGGSISSLLARFGRLPEAVICVYTRQLLSGLAYLHAQRTVHRDVKGANLLVETNGRVKLTDFGMAKQMVEAASFTKSFKGSAYWMAPEVVRQQGHGMAADIWSLGCTVLEMATGKPPWTQCTTQVQAIFKIASSQDLPAIPEFLSPQATEFVLLCLQRDPSARPSAESLLNHPFVTFEDASAVPALRSLDCRYFNSASSPTQPNKQRQQPGLPPQHPYPNHRSSSQQGPYKAAGGRGGGAPEALGKASSQLGKTPSGNNKSDNDAARAGKSPVGVAKVTQDSLIEQVLGKAGRDLGTHRSSAQKVLAEKEAENVANEDTVDFSVQPTNFKVRGLLSLSQLPLLAQSSLPVVHVSQLYARPSDPATPPPS